MIIVLKLFYDSILTASLVEADTCVTIHYEFVCSILESSILVIILCVLGLQFSLVGETGYFPELINSNLLMRIDVNIWVEAYR